MTKPRVSDEELAAEIAVSSFEKTFDSDCALDLRDARAELLKQDDELQSMRDAVVSMTTQLAERDATIKRLVAPMTKKEIEWFNTALDHGHELNLTCRALMNDRKNGV